MIDIEQNKTLWDRVIREFDCPHLRPILARRTSRNGAVTFVDQCRRCGVVVTTHRKANLDPTRLATAIEFDETISERWYKSRTARYEELRGQAERDRKAEWDRWYSAYLRSPEWAIRREKVMKRSGYVCEGCRDRPATEVHHLNYERVGHEMLFDLVAICNRCHGIIHGN